MDINITEDRNNAILNRREVNFNVTFEGVTPSRKDVKLRLAAMLNSPAELVIVQSIDNMFGKQQAAGYAKIYGDEGVMKSTEKEYMIKRNELPAEEPEAAAEEKASEAGESNE
jgi:small subunit ribosomal protein S24e